MPETIEQVQTDLADWKACQAAIRTGQEYRMGSMWMTRADLEKVDRIVTRLEHKLERMVRGWGIRVMNAVPR